MNFSWFSIIGFTGQGFFFSRFLVQWIASERKKESTFPLAFWFLSISGGVLLLIYSILVNDPVYTLGQSVGLLVYTRNLVLIRRSRLIERDR